ncbi:undecaprenyl-phosphate alpha-N-acetylglucosaminyl 1-phosphate transferase, partial [bacterium]|nr:undecaprenyl-phosphate alpha-N-acetylglucosaminyl 1-phosphate transferase [bacterium]
MWIITYVYILAFSFCVTLFTVKKSIKIANKLNIVDNPSNRKVHVSPTPLLGGLGIYCALV